MPERELLFADLFAGIGGFHLALHDDPVLRARCVFASDIDAHCRAVYETAFKMPVYGDIKQATAKSDEEIDRLVPDHDLLTAGFPCQPFSKSGAQRGIDEARGTLFYDICRILQVKRPRFVLLENVMNLVGPRHRATWDEIIYLLRTLGYAVSSSATVLSPHRLPRGLGSPQNRDRVFIPAVYVGVDADGLSANLPALLPRKPFPDWNPASWRVLADVAFETDSSDRYLIDEDRERVLEIWNDFVVSIDTDLPGFPLWADVFTGNLRESAANPKWKNKIVRKNREFFLGHTQSITRWLNRNGRLEDLKPSFRKLEWQAGREQHDIWSHAIQFRPSGIRVRPLTYLPALVAITQTSIIGPERRRLTPREAARLQGFPADFPFLENDAATYRQLGNAVSVGTARLVARSLLSVSHVVADTIIPLEWARVLNVAEERSRAVA